MTISKNSRGYSYSWGSSPTRLDPCEIVYIRGVHNTYAGNIQSKIPREPVHTLIGYIIFQRSSCLGVFLYEEFNWILFYFIPLEFYFMYPADAVRTLRGSLLSISNNALFRHRFFLPGWPFLAVFYPRAG